MHTKLNYYRPSSSPKGSGMLGGAIDGGHCDILFAYTNVRIVDKVANDESRKKKARQLSESAHVDNAESTHTYTFGRLLQPGQRFYT